MKTILKYTLTILFVNLGFAISAQIITNKSIDLQKTSSTKTSTSKPSKKTEITFSSASGTSSDYLASAANVPITPAAALRNFRLWFNNGDHKIRTIGILHDQGSMLAKFSDQNGDDPFQVEAQWLNIPGSTGGTISAAGSGTFNIQLPVKPSNTTLVISGFLFERTSGTDNNIRSMSIKMDQEKSLAQVSFIDDQGEDFRSVIENPVTTGALLVAPFGTLIDTALSSEQLVKALNNEQKKTARPYAVTIQYAFIPNSKILVNGSVSGTNRSNTGMSGQIPSIYAAQAIRGFALRFNNSDHHLLGVGIHLAGLKKFPGQRGSSDTDPVTWQDNNQDDPLQWLVDYSVIE